MKIILLTSKLNFETAGGSVVDVHLKAKGLAELGHDVTVITTFLEKNIIKEKLPYRVRKENITKRTLLNIQYRGYQILKKYEQEADAFYIDGQIFVYAGGLYRKCGGKVPVVAFFNVRLNCWGDMHGTMTGAKVTLLKKLKKKIRLVIERAFGVPIANNLDAFIFTTPMVAKLYLDWGFDKEIASIIPDFVDMQEIINKHNITEKSITEHQRDPKKLTIFSTGRMIPEKGFDLIIKAFALVPDKEKCHVVLSGGGPEKENLEQLVRDRGLEKYFTFTGWVSREELEQLLLRAHIFIFPKWWIEYTSVLLIEVFAFGLPCIIPGGGGVAWLANDKALVFREDNIEEMAKQIELLGNSEEMRIQIAHDLFARTTILDSSELLKKFLHVLESSAKVGVTAK
jgi:glycosyltransferase involved in cell wall biosynthesis